jgi:hypothetical protein
MKYNIFLLLTSISTIILIIIISYLFYCYNKTKIKKYSKCDVYFMSDEQTKIFLTYDKDRYVKNLSRYDLYARKVSTHDEYIEKIVKTALSFTQYEKDLLIRCTEKADIFFRNVKYDDLCYNNYITGNDIANIKWIFANTHSVDDIKNNIEYEYEEGLPHTRENIIFLSKNVLNYIEDDLVKTLIHEKIHIYQRLNVQLFNKIIKCMGFKQISLLNNEYVRSNPDTNRNIYIDNKTNKTMVCFYRSDKPTGINDVIMSNHSLEHPYEKMAYEIADYYYKDNKKYKDI